MIGFLLVQLVHFSVRPERGKNTCESVLSCERTGFSTPTLSFRPERPKKLLARDSQSMHHAYRNEAQRRQWQNPERVLVEIGVKAGELFIDCACGSGFFAVLAARMIGLEGVYAALTSTAKRWKNCEHKRREQV